MTGQTVLIASDEPIKRATQEQFLSFPDFWLKQLNLKG